MNGLLNNIALCSNLFARTKPKKYLKKKDVEELHALWKDRVLLITNYLGWDAIKLDEDEQVDFDFDLSAPGATI